MRVGDVALDSVVGATPVQIKFVEQVVEIGAKLDSCVFANDLEGRKTKRLAECGVHIEVARPSEHIAVNSRGGWQRSKTLLAAWTFNGIWIGEQTVEKCSGNDCWRREEHRSVDRCAASVVRLEPAKIGCRKQSAATAV